MSLESQYNLKSPGVKRLMREARELANPTEEYYACPLDDNLFEWHFTVRGPPETEFEGGYYHGRILLPPQYPMQPPNIILLTKNPTYTECGHMGTSYGKVFYYLPIFQKILFLIKVGAYPKITLGSLGMVASQTAYRPNGRFEINKKICLSISGYHPETWQPSWSIRTALLALIAFMPTKGAGTIGSLDYTPEERQVLAKKSHNWECAICGKIANKLISAESSASPALTQEESSMLQNIALKAEEDANRKEVDKEVASGKSEEKPPDTQSEENGPPGDIIPKGKSAVFRQPDYSSDIRQRSVPSTSGVSQIQNEITDEILRASIERSKRDRFWTTVIYVILFLIVLLLIRRLFLV